MNQPMTPDMVRALNQIEQDWNTTGKFKVPRGFDMELAVRNESFIRGIKNRGIVIPEHLLPDEETPVGYLSREQSAAVLTVLNFEDKRVRWKKLADLGISTAKWNGWMKDPKFKEYYMTVAENHFRDALPAAQEGLLRAIDKGSVEGIKYYMEMTGRHTSDSAGMQNLKTVIAKLIESIQMHVKDPVALEAIATDFDAIIKGGSPTPMKQLEGI